MPRKKDTKSKNSNINKVSVERTSAKSSSAGLFEKLQKDLQGNQSYLNLVLGGLIVLVIGVLLFNYFNKPKGDLGPAGQSQTQQEQVDVKKDSLPGKYTVKEGDTLFEIAQSYYNDGYKYVAIVEVNKLDNENMVEVGQILEIPKIEGSTPTPGEVTSTPTISPTSEPTKASDNEQVEDNKGQGGADNQTIWGEKITGSTYTVVPGDWLSKIAGRAYGDVNQFDKIAKANNIQNPDLIEPGMTLKIPR